MKKLRGRIAMIGSGFIALVSLIPSCIAELTGSRIFLKLGCVIWLDAAEEYFYGCELLGDEYDEDIVELYQRISVTYDELS